MKRLQIVNNLFLNIHGDGDGFEGSGYFIQVSDGDGITIANNTAFNRGNIATFHDAMPRGFVFKNNIAGLGHYGVFAALDMKSDEARTMFNSNIFMNLNGVADGEYSLPPGNTVVRSLKDVGFSNPDSGDFALSQRSRYAGAAGCDVSRLP